MASGTSASSCIQGGLLCFLDLASPGWRNASLANVESLLPIWSIKRAARPSQVAQVQSHAGTLFGGSFKPSSYLLRSNPALRHPSARLDCEFLQSTTPPPYCATTTVRQSRSCPNPSFQTSPYTSGNPRCALIFLTVSSQIRWLMLPEAISRRPFYHTPLKQTIRSIKWRWMSE